MRIIHIKGILTGFLCLISVLLVIGCATTKKITGDIMGEGMTLKKKIAFLPTVNNTGYGGKDFQESARVFLNTLLKRNCDNIINIDSPKIRDLLKQVPRLPSGQLDTMALANIGRTFGLNAVLEESLSEIECVEDKRGIWGFRDICTLAQLSVRIRAFDIETGAILIDEVVRDEVEVADFDWQGIKQRRGYHKETGARLLTKITPEISEKICDLLGNEPWKGYIASATEDAYTITAGKDVGLAIGDVLEVYGTREPIAGQAGQFYLVSGPKIGELRVAKVYKNRAEAIWILGSGLQNSSYVKLKR